MCYQKGRINFGKLLFIGESKVESLSLYSVATILRSGGENESEKEV